MHIMIRGYVKQPISYTSGYAILSLSCVHSWRHTLALHRRLMGSDIVEYGAGLPAREAAGFFPQLDITRYKRDGTSNEGVVEAGEEFRR